MWRDYNGLPRRLWRMTWSAAGVTVLVGGSAVVILLTVGAFIATGGRRDQSPATTEASVTATTTATAGPTAPPAVAATKPVAGTPSRSTGDAFIDGVTASIESNVSPPLADIAGQVLACSEERMTTAPECPPGAVTGSPVLSIITFQCQIGWSALTQDLQMIDDRDRLTLHSVLVGGATYTRPPAVDAVPDYWMLFTNSAPGLPQGYAIAVKDNKIVSWGRSCGPFATMEERLTTGSAGYLLAPP